MTLKLTLFWTKNKVQRGTATSWVWFLTLTGYLPPRQQNMSHVSPQRPEVLRALRLYAHTLD